VVDGGEEELVRFCGRVQPKLVSTLALYLCDVGVAEELAQEALVRAWERWPQVSGCASPEAWVYRVAFNLSKSVLRRRRLERRHLRRSGPEPGTAAPEVTDRLAVRDALAALPPRQRAAVVLRYLADFGVEDTALAMRCAPGTVKALTTQALAKLADRFQVDDPEGADIHG